MVAGLFRGTVPWSCYPSIRRERSLIHYHSLSIRADMSVPAVDVAIIGGGLGGLALARGLQHRGIDAHVFEAAPRLRTHSGTVISIAKHGNTALDGLVPGLSQDILDRGVLVKQIRSNYVQVDGSSLKNNRDMTNDEMVLVGWHNAQTVLGSKVEPSTVHCSHRFKSFHVTEDGVDATFEIRDGTESNGGKSTTTVSAKLLVGADGMRSAVRKQLVGDEPRYVGILSWNAIVLNPGLSLFQGHDLEEIVVAMDLSTGMALFLADAGESHSFWQVRTIDRDASLSNHYGESLGGFGKQGCKDRVLEILGDHPLFEAARKVALATDERLIFERRMIDRLPIDKWSDDSGRVVLLGDAAHGMYPGPGEGARQAFEDAHQLCLILKDIDLTSSESILEAVQRYEEARITRCHRCQRFASETFDKSEADKVFNKLNPLERRERSLEFTKWLSAYPNKINGDPDSKYWK